MRMPFGPWLPDRAHHNQKMMGVAFNVLPTIDGYRPMKDFTEHTNALGSRCRGAGVFRRDDGSLTTIAGDVDTLYKLTGTTWGDISDATYTSNPDNGVWKFTQFGELAIMTNYADVIKKYDIATAPATVSSLGGSPPKARHIATVRDQVWIGDLANLPNGVAWSGIGDAEEWTPGTNSSDQQELFEGGRVMNLVGGDVAYIFQERMIRRGVFTPGAPTVYDIQPIDFDRGCLAIRGMVKIGSNIFFYAHDGFFVFSGGQTRPIATEKVLRWFYENADTSFTSRLVAGADPRSQLVFFSFISKDNTGEITSNLISDKCLVYHWPTDRWACVEIDVEAFADYVTVSTGLDSLDSISSSIDALAISLDSLVWNADNISSLLALFSRDHKMGFLEGSNKEALFEIYNVQMFSPRRQLIRGVTPYVDSDGSVYVKYRPKEKIQDKSAMWLPETATEDATGHSKDESSARMHDIGIRIPAGEDWNHAQGMFIHAHAEGDG